MNILLVTPFDPSAIGGVSTAVQMLRREFSAKGHNVHMLVLGENKLFAKRQGLEWSEYSLYLRQPIHGHFNIRCFLKFLMILPITVWQLGRLCRKQNIDAVYVQYPLPHFVYIGILKRLSRWKLIVTFQGNDAHDLDSWRNINRWCLGYLLKSADEVTGVAESLLQKVLATFPTLVFQTNVIPNGAELSEEIDAQVNCDVSLPSRFILSVGHVIPRKGFDVLLRGLARVSAQCPDLHLVIAGDGPAHAALRDLVAELKLNDKVHFVGWRSHQQTMDLMRRCLFFALTSRQEGLPLVIVEAMMMGKTVLATSIDGIPDIVDNERTGILVPTEDFEAVGCAIGHLASNDQLRKRLELSACQQARREYTWTSIAQRYLEIAGMGKGNKRQVTLRPQSKLHSSELS